LSGNEWRYVKDCLDNNWLSLGGPYIKRFEGKMANYLGTPQAVATVNGTSAIHIALLLAGVGPEDLVLVPSLTFIGSVNPIRYCGAEPVFIDADPNTWNMDVNQTRDKIKRLIKSGRKPKAIIAVHLYGLPVDMDPIMTLAREFDISVIEDATEALGALYKGSQAGTIGEVGCLSFNGNKLITTGGGGMFVTANKDHAMTARSLVSQAREEGFEYFHKKIGYNYRLPSILAALGLAQLEQIDIFLAKKKMIADFYQKTFSCLPGVELRPRVTWAQESFWLYGILVKEEFGVSSRELIKRLVAEGIEARPFFQPIHMQPVYKELGARCPVAESLWKKGVSLPSHVGLDETGLERVAQTVLRVAQK
jgi:dTDP-4-amino-4,6-dideoxygalactose transaminase